MIRSILVLEPSRRAAPGYSQGCFRSLSSAYRAKD